MSAPGGDPYRTESDLRNALEHLITLSGTTFNDAASAEAAFGRVLVSDYETIKTSLQLAIDLLEEKKKK